MLLMEKPNVFITRQLAWFVFFLWAHVFTAGVRASVLMFPCDDLDGKEPQNINPIKLTDHFLVLNHYQD